MLLEALQCARATGADEVMDDALALLGYCALLDNLATEAHAWLGEALALAAAMGHTLQIATNLFALALAAGMMGRFEHAARLLGAWDALCEQHGIVFGPRERAMVEDGRERLRAAMGDAALTEVLAEGQALPLDDVLKEALEGVVLPAIADAPPVEDSGAMPA
jgi:hypothetical protein